jgi:hypothetical protein
MEEVIKRDLSVQISCSLVSEIQVPDTGGDAGRICGRESEDAVRVNSIRSSFLFPLFKIRSLPAENHPYPFSLNFSLPGFFYVIYIIIDKLISTSQQANV